LVWVCASAAVACGRIGFAELPVADAPGPCGVSVALDDHFAGTTIDTTLWKVNAGAATLTQNDSLIVQFPAVAQPTDGAGAQQRATTNVLGECLTARLLESPTPATHAYCDVGWIAPNRGQVAWTFDSGLMRATYFDASNGSTINVAKAAFDPSLYLRVRNDASGDTWETSQDGVVFSPFASAPNDTSVFDPTSASVYFTCAVVNNGMTTANAGRGVLEFVHVVMP
jgi:hypothetical protein